MFYNIHNQVFFALYGPDSLSNSFRYSKYRTDVIKPNDLDFIVNVGEFTPDLVDCLKYDDKYYVKKNYLYCKHDCYKLLNWEIEFKNLEDKPIQIHIKINSLMRYFDTSYILLEGAIIDPLIHYILIRKGGALLHASCVKKNDKGILFIARGGAGKTTISTNLIQHGYSFISDNYTIINSLGLLMGFVEPLNIFSYNLSETIKTKLTTRQKIELILKQIIFRASRGYVKLFLRVMPNEIFTNISNSTPLHSLFLIVPCARGTSEVNLNAVTKTELISRIVANQRLEFPFIDKYFIVYSYAFPLSKISTIWDTYSSILSSTLQGNFYSMEVPMKYTDTVITSILNLIETRT